MIDYSTWTMSIITVPDQPAALNPSQRKIFWCTASGLTLNETAAYLGISVRTVKSQKQLMVQKIPGLTCLVAYGALATDIIAEHRRLKKLIAFATTVSQPVNS